MEDIFVGDRIALTFDDIPRDQITARVTRKLSDTQEGLSPEIEDYVDYWLEISCDGDKRGTICNVLLLTTGQYWFDGRYVTIYKMG